MKSPGRKVGVLECVEGVLRGATLGALDGTVSVPVLLITSTRDALDTSGTAEVSRQAGGPHFVLLTVPRKYVHSKPHVNIFG